MSNTTLFEVTSQGTEEWSTRSNMSPIHVRVQLRHLSHAMKTKRKRTYFDSFAKSYWTAKAKLNLSFLQSPEPLFSSLKISPMIPHHFIAKKTSRNNFVLLPYIISQFRIGHIFQKYRVIFKYDLGLKTPRWTLELFPAKEQSPFSPDPGFQPPPSPSGPIMKFLSVFAAFDTTDYSQGMQQQQEQIQKT